MFWFVSQPLGTRAESWLLMCVSCRQLGSGPVQTCWVFFFDIQISTWWIRSLWLPLSAQLYFPSQSAEVQLSAEVCVTVTASIVCGCSELLPCITISLPVLTFWLFWCACTFLPGPPLVLCVFPVCVYPRPLLSLNLSLSTCQELDVFHLKFLSCSFLSDLLSTVYILLPVLSSQPVNLSQREETFPSGLKGMSLLTCHH